jgi:hypothetical protein
LDRAADIERLPHALRTSIDYRYVLHTWLDDGGLARTYIRDMHSYICPRESMRSITRAEQDNMVLKIFAGPVEHAESGAVVALHEFCSEHLSFGNSTELLRNLMSQHCVSIVIYQENKIIASNTFSIMLNTIGEPIIDVHVYCCSKACKNMFCKNEWPSNLLLSTAIELMRSDVVHVLAQSVGYAYKQTANKVISLTEQKDVAGRAFWAKVLTRSTIGFYLGAQLLVTDDGVAYSDCCFMHGIFFKQPE